MLNASQAFLLADKVAYHYNKKNAHSDAINTNILQTLGPELYRAFCKEIRIFRTGKNFSEKFLNNPVEKAASLTDSEVYESYSLGNILKALSQITATNA